MLRAALFAVAFLCAAGTAFACPASYYGSAHHGRKTASGERFDMHAMTAAHRSYPFGTKVRVTYRGKSVVVRINDRGPFAGGRCIDLSAGAARALGMIRAGVGSVTLQRLN
jgi:rare lipoprotein A